MKLIIGLGNPGDEYESTRHNIGFMVLDKLARDLTPGEPVWKKDEKRNVLTTKIGDILLVKPQTFMNNSGFAVKALLDFYKLAPSDVWIVHDDMDLPLEKIKIREKGSSAGHNGVQSIIDQLKTDTFVRFRLGIGRRTDATGSIEDKNVHHQSVITFVLSHFRQSEAGALKHLIKHGAEAVQLALDSGIEKAMNRFN